jgi:hypothetical protein
MIKPIKIENYLIVPDTINQNMIITYPDGSTIQTDSLQVEGVAIVPNDRKWSVILLTKSSLLKYREKYTSSLATFGLTFNSFNNAIIVNELFARTLFDQHKKESHG